MMIFAKWLLLTLFFFLNACTSVTPFKNYIPKPENKELVAQHKDLAKKVSSWELQGAIAAKNKSKGWTAAMYWTQNSVHSYQIRLMGPLGAGTVLITRKGNQIYFQDGPKKLTSSNAEELLLQQTGIKLPVNNLYYWVRGFAAPGLIQSESHDDVGHLIQLKQSDYTIEFNRYITVKNTELPTLIRLQGNGILLKVLIKKWII